LIEKRQVDYRHPFCNPSRVGVMNLNTLLARILRGFFGLFSRKNTLLTWVIKKRYDERRLAKEKVIFSPGCSTPKYLAPVFFTFSASPILAIA